MVSFEHLLQEIDDFGIYQKVRYLLICLAALLPPIVTYTHSFIAPKLSAAHRCRHPYLGANDSFTTSYFFNDSSTNLTSLGKCDYTVGDQKIKCDSWVFNHTYYQKTLTEQWSMVCDRSGWIGSVQTVYFAGYLVGSLVLGILADKFGRRPIMLSSFIMLIIGGLGVAFGPQEAFGTWPSYIIYAVSRFIIACGTRGINVTGFVLGMEMMGPSKRLFAGIVIEYFFAFGQLVLVGIAFINNVLLKNDWRAMAIFLVLPCIPFLSYFFFLPESPRWLLSKNRQDEALKILQQVAKANKRELNPHSWQSLLEHHYNSAKSKNAEETIRDAVKSPSLCIMSCILFLNWIINNLLFYGLGLKSSDLGVNPYLSFAISAFVEIIAYIIVHLILDRIGRKLPYFVFLFLAGLSCFSVTFITDNLIVVVLAMIGKMCASASYAIIYLYTSELFPTSIRNTGMGTCSMMARIGAMIAPKVLDLSVISVHLPFLIIGITGLVGAASAIALPETLKRNLPENIKEAEKANKLGISCKAMLDYDDDEFEQADPNELKKLNE